MKFLSKNLSYIFLFVLGLYSSLDVIAQSAKAFEKAGDRAFAERDYYTALVHFQEAMEQQSNPIGLWYKYAEAARRFNAYGEAEKYYTKVWRSQQVGNFLLAGFWLAQVKKNLGKYQEALELFQEYLNMQPMEGYYVDWAKKELETCQWAIEAKPSTNPTVRIDHLDKNINSPYSEFGAYEYGNTLYYSSMRYNFRSDKHYPGRRLAKILSAKNLEKGKLLPRNFNEADKHTAHTTIGQDGDRIYFTLCQYVGASDIRCEIYYRDKDKRGNWDKKAVRLPEAINKKGFTATQPSIGYDSIAQKELLYFSSDRPGGKGKMDIWYCELEEGKFMAPQNLELVNTPEDDITPFYSSTEQRLYFSSTGHPGFGGYDIFKINRMPEWGEVENIGKPINSSYHDLYYNADNAALHSYLSSNRPGSFYLDENNKACCYDIYRVEFSFESEYPEDGDEVVETRPEEPARPKVPETLEDFLPLALYFDNDEPDKRTQRITTKKSYDETYRKYISRRKEFVRQFTRHLPSSEADEAAMAIEDFFEHEIKKGFEHLNLFSEILLNRLEAGERVEIVIKGYTSPRAGSDYNDRLARRRISSLINYFSSYKDGVFESFLRRDKLVISELPFGETTASAETSDDLQDEQNSIYGISASKERRVEIVELR